jgi:starvation-inducible DNA-binding protein
MFVGESFMEFHKLFEAQYTELEASIDDVAERISKLGGKSINYEGVCRFNNH